MLSRQKREILVDSREAIQKVVAMSTASWDEASRCYRCETPGVETRTTNGRAGAKDITLRCEESRCRGYKLTWVVHINPDGTIPVRGPGPKSFPRLPWRSKEELDKMQEDFARQAKMAEGEVNNPWSQRLR